MVMIYKHLNALLWFSFGIIFLLFSSTKAADSEKWDPTRYVNLSPFRQWRSAYECILNETNPCEPQYKLTMSGIVYVPQEDVGNYCGGSGCAEHVRIVLHCIHQVKRDFWFANSAPVQFINNSINHGCDTTTSINTTKYPKN
ncbi:hypothetical protein Q3G72_018793 [Acer saccharum]|nr:hypothetical protein Q3G72_018793 [Acer saccharum]